MIKNTKILKLQQNFRKIVKKRMNNEKHEKE